jgi:hypothetical protein
MGIPPFHHESLSKAKGNAVLRNDRNADFADLDGN